jgi:hypothetical protein
MFKKAIILAILLMLAFQGAAFAQDSSGAVVLEDTLYGAVVGAVLGGAWYLLDRDDAGDKLAIGTGVGAFAGFALGLTDAFSVVEVEPNGDVKYAMPTLMITGRNGADFYSANLLKVNF